jgi:hypothetical protein
MKMRSLLLKWIGSAVAMLGGVVVAVIVQAVFGALAHSSPPPAANPVYFDTLHFDFETEEARRERDRLRDTIKGCGHDQACFLRLMRQSASQAKTAYGTAVAEMHPVIRSTLGHHCRHLNTKIIERTFCYKDGIAQMISDAEFFQFLRKEDPRGNTGALLEEQMLAANQFVGLILKTVCGERPTNNCFDGNLAALREQLVAANNAMVVASDRMASWSIFSFACGENVAPNVCLRARNWARELLPANPEAIEYRPTTPLPGRNARAPGRGRGQGQGGDGPRPRDRGNNPPPPGPETSGGISPQPPSPPSPPRPPVDPGQGTGNGTGPGNGNSGTGNGGGCVATGNCATNPEPAPSGTTGPTGAPAPSPLPAPTGEPGPTGEPAPTGEAAPTGQPAPTGVPAPTGSPAPTGAPAPTSAPAPTGTMPAPTGTAQDYVNSVPQTNPNEDQLPVLDCSPEAVANAARYRFRQPGQQPSFEAQITAQAIHYACKVRKDFPTNRGAVFLAEAALRLASISRRSEWEIMASTLVEDWFAWVETQAQSLQQDPAVAGQPEIAQFARFVAETRAGGREAMYTVVLGRNRPGSTLRTNFCPFKAATETAAPGSTSGFPSLIIACPYVAR